MILAHGAGTADLPVESWALAYGTAAVLLLCAAALRLTWTAPRLDASAQGRRAPAWLAAVARVGRPVAQVVAAALVVATMAAAWFGGDDPGRNLAPSALHVGAWATLPLVAVLLGDVWRHANPLWLAAAGLDRLRGRDPSSSSATDRWASHVPAALGVSAFAWLWLAHHDPTSVAAVATFLSVGVVAVLIGADRFGAGWVRTGDGLAVLLSLLAALAPVHRDEGGRLRVRVPGAGVARVDVRRGTLALLLVVIGSTAFDGVTATAWWGDVAGGRRGWELTGVRTAGLALTIATVGVGYLVAVRLVGRSAGEEAPLGSEADRWAPVLVPVAVGYLLAHATSLLVSDGQAVVALLSDPLGRGWDLFGTAGHRIDRGVATVGQIVAVQVATIALGHVAAVVAVHDRALGRWPHREAVRNQVPLLVALVASGVAAALLLAGG